MAIELDKLAGPSGGTNGQRLADFWTSQINTIKDSAEYKRWCKRGEDIEKRYRDERNRIDGDDAARRYNALWSNVEILKPALYGRTPQPIAERRFRDKDPVGRSAATILERALRNEIEICGYDDALRRAVNDYLLPGRGTVWVRYEPEFSESISLPPDPQIDQRDAQGDITPPKPRVTPKGRVRAHIKEEHGEETDIEEALEDPALQADEEELEQQKLDDTGVRIVRESTPVDFIGWKDFMTFPSRARTWREVTAVGKRVYLSRNQAKKRFGKEIGSAVPLERDNRGHRDQNTTLQGTEQDKCQVWEIWDKDKREVVWVCVGYSYLLDRKDDPLKLDTFFPTPVPLYANPTNNTLCPVPDYIQYQDQAIQIDELTQRIALLTRACKIAGVYNAAAKDIQRMFSESLENELIPVDDWAAFAEKGGVEGNISFAPIQEIMTVLNELMTCKQQQIEEMDRLTGINDIMRGTSDARETLGGVRLKVNSTGTRLTSRQNEVARFARDVVRLMADIMSQHFSPQSLIEASGALHAEGLGPDDMPPLTALQNPTAPPQPRPQGLLPPSVGQMPQQGAPQPPQGPPMMGGPPMGAPPQMPPQQPPMGGANVIPFKPPGGLMGGPPGMPPQMPPQPQVPQMDPEMLRKLEAIFRIAKGIQLLRNERLRGFRVDIEVDSTIFPDQTQEKEDRMEFLTATTGFLQQALQMGAMAPESIPLLAKLLQYGTRGNRVGRDLESAIEEFSDQATAMAQRMITERQNQPNPDLIKVQTEQMKTQAQIHQTNMQAQSDREQAQAEIMRQHIENEGERRNAEIDAQSNAIDLQIKQIDMQIAIMKLELEKMKAQASVQQTNQQMEMDQQKMQHETHARNMDMAMQQQEHVQNQQDRELDRQAQHEDREMERQDRREDRAMQVQQNKDQLALDKQKHQQDMKFQQQSNQQKLQQQKAQAAAKPKPASKK